MTDKAELDNRAYYDEFAAGYERERHHGYHALIDELETSLVLRYARDAVCLEAGCGTGMILKEVAPQARRAVGFDLSMGMLEHSRRRGLEVVHASVTEVPFADDVFDVVYSFKVLAHVRDIGRAVAELARVTRPGGHLLLEFYNPWSLRYLVKRMKPATAISQQTTDEAVYTRYDSLSMIRGYLPASLKIVDLRGVRIFTPLSHLHRVPLLGAALADLERRSCDAPGLRRLGGFMIVVAQKL
jgi:ubiquinone/menaquinone biosynthesis C-methylase UbiE